MRPLNKGVCPKGDDGNEITPTDYDKWRKSLIDRIGYYCVYCNQPLSHSLQVEHVIPKNPPAGYTVGDALAWENMLLACGPCNNAKDNTPIDRNTYYLPEEHNTHLAFEITEDHNNPGHAIVITNPDLNESQETKSQRTIDLLQLDNIDLRPAIVDIRSLKRHKAIIAVILAKNIFESLKLSPTYNADIAAKDIAARADASGFFSLWYNAFADEPLVMQYLTDGAIIKGTAQDCFDPANGFKPIPRNNDGRPDPI